MGPGFTDEIGRQLARFVIILVVISFSFGALGMWGLPKLWEWIKPIIHGWTT